MKGRVTDLLISHPKLSWFCLIAGLLAVGMALWGREHSESPLEEPEPIKAALDFQRYTNILSSGRWAIMTLTNKEDDKLFLCGPRLVEVLNTSSSPRHRRWKNPNIVPPRASVFVEVEVPADLGPWRASLVLERFTWRDRLNNSLPDWLPERLVRVRPTHTHQEVASEWVQE